VVSRPISPRFPYHDFAELERGVRQFSVSGESALIVMSAPVMESHGAQMVQLLADLRLPAVYPYSHWSPYGALITYGPDLFALYREAAKYVDRILRGEKAGDLPIQAPTKYELIINLKTAKAIGLSVPPLLLARADEVIE
jgi:putative ABC transport system substrate-binding protein